MLRFKLLLRGLSFLLKKEVRTNPDCAAYIRGKDLVFQIRTHNGSGRYFIVRDGKIRSHAGLADKPTFTMSFQTATKGFAILSAKDSQNAFLSGVGREELVLSGDFVEIMWFQGLTAFLQPEKKLVPSDRTVF